MTYASKPLLKIPVSEGNPSRIKPIFWQSKIAPAFWTIAGIVSLIVNVILIVALIVLGRQLFSLKGIVQNQLIGGLYTNFKAMDASTIITTVQVEDTIPVEFDLPVKTNTTVILTEATPIYGAQVSIVTPYMTINAPADIVLPEGLPLPIALDISVPVSTTVPVVLTVPVDIPLNESELHEPFVGLQEVVSPYDSLLTDLPNSWQETPLCQGVLRGVCKLIFDLPESK
jgi:hypothetical protein